MKIRVCYIGGKFTGKNAWDVAQNVRAAEHVGFAVAQMGLMPLIPHANTHNFFGTLDEAFWYGGTLELLRRCDALVLVPGWRSSAGTRRERDEAERLGLPIFEAEVVNGEVWMPTLLQWARDGKD